MFPISQLTELVKELKGLSTGRFYALIFVVIFLILAIILIYYGKGL